MNLAAAFATSAQNNLQKTAIFWGDQEYSYGVLSSRAARLAGHLQQLEVKPGDRVGLWLKNCPEFVPALFGILQAGGVVVPINNFLKPEEVSYILGDAGIDVLISDHSTTEGLSKLSSARPQLKFWMVEDFSRLDGETSLEPGTLEFPERTQSDLAVIIYTSGTTGRPKGAMLSHGNLLSNVDSCRQVLEAVDADRFLVLLPM